MSTILNVNIAEMVKAGAKMHHMTFIDFDICHQIASLQKLYSMTLTNFLKVGTKFETLFSLKWLEIAQKCNGRLLQKMLFALNLQYCKHILCEHDLLFASKKI